MKRLAIITTHPIQYNAPLFKMLHERGQIAVKVFYTWSQTEKGAKYDPGFGKNIEWDIPLLEGYEYSFIENVSKKPGSNHFFGIDNPGLIKEIENWKPDVLLIYGWSFKSHLQCMRYFKGKLLVLFRGDSTLLDEAPGLKKELRRQVLKWVYKNVDCALYVGAANKDYFKAHGLTEKKLVWVPHAIDNARFGIMDKAMQESVAEKKQALGIEADDVLFLFTGKLETKKDPMLLLQAVLNTKAANIKLLFVGNGSEEAVLKKMAGTDTRILFMDFQNQSQMPFIYRLCDIFVLPSAGPGETWGLSVNEAMACSKPVLVSDKCGCAADLVQNGVNGYVFQSGNTKDLEDKILILASDKSKLVKMGAQSLDIIKEWSFEKAAAGIEKTVQLIQ